MASPPRLSLRPAMPSTPKKPFRARPRTLNRPAREKCRKCLFGPPDHAELAALLQKEMRALNTEKREEWSFDFETGTPLSGGDWQWERITPTLKRSKGSPQCTPKSPLVAEVAGFTFPLPRPRYTAGNVGEEAASEDDVAVSALEATPMKLRRMKKPVPNENAFPNSSAVPSTSIRPSATTFTPIGLSASEADENAHPLVAATPLSPNIAASASVTPTTRTSATPANALRKSQTRQSGGVAQRRLQEYFPIKRRAVDAQTGSASLKRVRTRLDF